MLSNLRELNWKCKHTWKRSAINTAWCLLGCSIGDFGTIFYFQMIEHTWSIWAVMSLAIMNGLITSIILETILLLRQKFSLKEALQVAFGMSFISMVAMEASMNITDIVLAGGKLTWWVIPIMLFMGFITPWPYNYYRLKKHGLACH